MVYNARVNARLTSLLACTLLIAFSAGASCDSDDGYLCTVTWTEDGTEVGMTMFDYPDISNAEAASDQCEVDQEDDADRPMGANGYSCTCNSK